MTVDAPRHPCPPGRPSLVVAACTATSTAVALVAIAALIIACAPTRDTHPPTPRPTLAQVTGLVVVSRRS